ATAPCILMNTEGAVVRGLTLRGIAGSQGKKFYAVDLPTGKLLLENCDITSDSLACVAIYGSASNPTIRNCKIHARQRSGRFVTGRGKGTMEDCDIFSTKRSGVLIRGGGDPTIRDCKIRDGQESGVLVYEQGKGTIEGCDIFANECAGVEIRQGSAA